MELLQTSYVLVRSASCDVFNNEALVHCVLRFAISQSKSCQSSRREGLPALSPPPLPSLDSHPRDMFGFGCFEVAGFVNLLLHPVLINISCQPPSCQAVPLFPLLIFMIFLMLCLQLQTLSHHVEQIGWNVAVAWFWLDKNKIKVSFLSRSGLLSHALLKTKCFPLWWKWKCMSW